MISFSFDFADDVYQVPPVPFEAYGHLMSIASIQESVGTQATGTKITLAGLELEEGRAAAEEDLRGRRVNIYLGLFDAEGALIPVPYMIFGGLGDNSNLSIDAENGVTFTLNAENSMISLQQAAVALLTDADQQARYPGDKGLEYAGRMKNTTVKWGSA